MADGDASPPSDRCLLEADTNAAHDALARGVVRILRIDILCRDVEARQRTVEAVAHAVFDATTELIAIGRVAIVEALAGDRRGEALALLVVHIAALTEDEQLRGCLDARTNANAQFLERLGAQRAAGSTVAVLAPVVRTPVGRFRTDDETLAQLAVKANGRAVTELVAMDALRLETIAAEIAFDAEAAEAARAAIGCCLGRSGRGRLLGGHRCGSV